MNEAFEKAKSGFEPVLRKAIREKTDFDKKVLEKYGGKGVIWEDAEKAVQPLSWIVKISADGEIRPMQIKNCTDLICALDAFGIQDKVGTFKNPLDYENMGCDSLTDIEARCNFLMSEQSSMHNYMASKLLGKPVYGDIFINAQMLDQWDEVAPRGFQFHGFVNILCETFQKMIDESHTLEEVKEDKKHRVDITKERPTEFRGLGTAK